MKKIQTTIITGIVIFLIVLLFNVTEVLKITNLFHINPEKEMLLIYLTIATVLSLGLAYITAYLAEFIYRLDGVFTTEEGINARFAGFVAFFVALCGIMFANLFGDDYFITVSILVGGLFIIMAILSYVLPKIIGQGARSGAEEGSSTASEAVAIPADGEPTEDRTIAKKWPFWFWIMIVLAGMIFLGALSRGCNNGTQQVSSGTGTGTVGTQSSNINQSGNTNTGQQSSSQGQGTTINLENLKVKDEFRPKGNGTSGIGATEQEKVSGIGAIEN